MTVTMDDVTQAGGDELPELDAAKDFYANYEPKEVLGRGVSSTVRLCVEKVTGKQYAAKIIDLTGEKDNEYQMNEILSATKKEMNIMRLCAEHPFIIHLHDTFESPTFIFLVMELCPKGELFDYLTEVVTLSEKRTRQIMRQLLESVHFCHQHNIVHRDLKPENILLDDNLSVKLSDFGFATIVDGDEDLQDLCGTPGYLAPEVLKVSMYENATGYGKPVDMWACGVIMYTLLVGCPPFWHRKQMYMLRAIMEGRYSFSSPEWNDISDAPKDLISKFLVVDPSKRITAEEALAHPFFHLEENVPPSLPDCVTNSKHFGRSVSRQASTKRKVSLQREAPETREFFPRRLFRAAVITVIGVHRIKNLHLNPPPISLEDVRRDPYGQKAFRKFIDAGAFKIYGHWVKKGENQNRAALFENVPKKELKSSESALLEQGVLEFEVKGRVGRRPVKLRMSKSGRSAPELRQN